MSCRLDELNSARCLPHTRYMINFSTILARRASPHRRRTCTIKWRFLHASRNVEFSHMHRYTFLLLLFIDAISSLLQNDMLASFISFTGLFLSYKALHASLHYLDWLDALLPLHAHISLFAHRLLIFIGC